MNKNPERPENMDEIMSKIFNPNFKTEKENYQEKQKKILEGIFK